MAQRATQEATLISSGSPGLTRSTHEALLISLTIPTVGIAYPLTAPAIAGLGPQDFSLTAINVIGENDSPFSLSQEIQLWPGQLWEIEANFPPMLTSEGEQWVSFLLALYGKYGTFLMGDYNRPTPQGPMSGSPVVSGSNAAGAYELFVRGAAASVTNWAVAGDYVQITAPGSPQRLYKILQNASSDGSGDVTLNIFPSLREALSDGNPIIIENCAGTFRLQQNSYTWKIDHNKMYSISFKAKEAISV
jgi:hypothetical protein